MKTPFPPHRRAFAALVPTLALLAVPAVAQDQQTTPVAPPPVVSTAPAPAPVAPVQVAPAPVQAAPVQTVQTAPVEAPPPPDAAPERTTTRAARAPATTHSATRRTTTTRTTNAPVAATPVVTPAPAPAPVAATPETAPVVTPAPAPAAQTSTTTQTTTVPASTGFNWASPWLALLGVGIIALIGFLFAARRRRADVYETYDEPVAYEEPIREPAPIAPEPVVAAAPIVRPDAQFLRREAPRPIVAPVVAEEQVAAPVAGTGELVAPSDSDVEALTAGNPPVADRPWLEMAMRPVRAGTNVDEALVEIELTVGNAGSVAADDVRISTFMFASAPADDEMERLLLEHDGEVPVIRIKPGEGTTLEATLALPRADLSGSVSPVIVADARYPLPGGGEGRTAASFRISVSDDGEAMTPIPIGRPHMFDEVSAELYGVPEHT